jgi:hypothetical protein
MHSVSNRVRGNTMLTFTRQPSITQRRHTTRTREMMANMVLVYARRE